MKKGVMLISLIFLLTIGTIFFVNAQEIRITTPNLNVINYNVWNDLVIFIAKDSSLAGREVCSYDNICSMGGFSSIFVYNLTSGELQNVGEGYTPTIPLVYNNRYILFMDKNDFLVYDLEDSQILPADIVVEVRGGTKCSLAYEGVLVCNERDETAYKINIHDSKMGGAKVELFNIPQVDYSDIQLGGFDGNLITYTSEQEIPQEISDNADLLPPSIFKSSVWLYNIDSSTRTKITEDSENVFMFSPIISENTIVWTQATGREAEWGFFYYDLDNGEIKSLNLDSSLGRATPQFSFSEDKLAWVDHRHFNVPIIGKLLYRWFGIGDNPEIYLYDFETGEEERITSNPSQQLMPKISNNKLFWMDKRNQAFEVYYKDLV